MTTTEFRKDVHERFKELRDNRIALEKAERSLGFPARAWKLLADAGLFNAVVSKESGGNGQGVAGAAIVLEEFAATGTVTLLPVLTTMVSLVIDRFGSKELKARVLPDIFSGKYKICVATTELEAGFNLFHIKTSANKISSSHYALSGIKAYTTAANIADSILVVARTRSQDESKSLGLSKTDGLSLFLVDAASPGIEKIQMNTRGEGLMKQFITKFNEVEVSNERLIGKENEGAQALFTTFNVERILFASLSIGIAEFCLRVATEHARERKVFGDSSIGSYQSIQHPLADVKIRQQSLKLLVQEAATAVDRGLPPKEVSFLANSAKYLASELSNLAVDAALNALGGTGFNEDVGVIQLLELARLMKLSPISNGLILNDTAERVLGLPRSY